MSSAFKTPIQSTKLVLINCATALLLLGISELFVRIFMPSVQQIGTDSNLIVQDAYQNIDGLNPGSSGMSHGALVEVDEYGLRKSSNEINPDYRSWLLLGDSVTMGIGVDADSTFSGRIAAAQSHTMVNILNPSLAGYSTSDYLAIAKAWSSRTDKLKPERLIVFFCLNDIYSSVPVKDEPGLRGRGFAGKILVWIKYHLRTWQVLKNLMTDRPETYFQHDRKYFNKKNPHFDQSIRQLSQIVRLCREASIQFDLILLPYEFQLRDPANLDVFQPQQIMVEVLSRFGISIYDPRDFLIEKMKRSKDFYLYGDGIHFSNDGHKLIAEYFNKYISQQTHQ